MSIELIILILLIIFLVYLLLHQNSNKINNFTTMETLVNLPEANSSTLNHQGISSSEFAKLFNSQHTHIPTSPQHIHIPTSPQYTHIPTSQQTNVDTTGVTCNLVGGEWVASDPAYKCASSTRYWDCSRPTCSWNPGSCSGAQQHPYCADNSGYSVGQSGQGKDYISLANQPYYDQATNTVYATAAVSGSLGIGQQGGPACGKCYEAYVTNKCGNPYYVGGCNNSYNQNAAGTKLVIMDTNFCPDQPACPLTVQDKNAADAHYHFDIALPGGGVGGQNHCQTLYNNQNPTFMKANSISDCSNTSIIPTVLADGCKTYFNNLKQMDNPMIAFKEITCPNNVPSFNKLNGK